MSARQLCSQQDVILLHECKLLARQAAAASRTSFCFICGQAREGSSRDGCCHGGRGCPCLAPVHCGLDQAHVYPVLVLRAVFRVTGCMQTTGAQVQCNAKQTLLTRQAIACYIRQRARA